MIDCDVCGDTHRMWNHGLEREVMCTRCPRPCQLCRSGGNGPYCSTTPCACDCHVSTPRTPTMSDARLSDEDIEIAALANQRPGGQQVGMYIPPIVAFQRSTGYAVVIHETERSQHKTAVRAKEQLALLLAEIRHRRSRQLSAADREALEFVALDIRGQAPIDNSGYVCGKWRAALVTIDRLLATAEDA